MPEPNLDLTEALQLQDIYTLIENRQEVEENHQISHNVTSQYVHAEVNNHEAYVSHVLLTELEGDDAYWQTLQQNNNVRAKYRKVHGPASEKYENILNPYHMEILEEESFNLTINNEREDAEEFHRNGANSFEELMERVE